MMYVAVVGFIVLQWMYLYLFMHSWQCDNLLYLGLMLCICCHSYGILCLLCVFLSFRDDVIMCCICGRSFHVFVIAAVFLVSCCTRAASCFIVLLWRFRVDDAIVFMCCNVGLQCCTLGAFVFAHVFMMVGSFLYLDLMIRICCHFYGTLCLLCIILIFWDF